MKQTFKDSSSIEINKDAEDNITIIIKAKDFNNPNKLIANAVEISIDEFKRLLSDIL